MNDPKLLDTIGTPGTRVNVAALITANLRIRTRGVSVDALEYRLTIDDAAAVELALAARTFGDGQVGMQFRGIPVIASGAHARSYIVAPPTPHNDRAESTGLRIDIVGGVDDPRFRTADDPPSNLEVVVLERFDNGTAGGASADCDVPRGTAAIVWALGVSGGTIAAATPGGFVPVLVEYSRLRADERPRAVVLVERTPERSQAPDDNDPKETRL